jgi:hypothetical protein
MSDLDNEGGRWTAQEESSTQSTAKARYFFIFQYVKGLRRILSRTVHLKDYKYNFHFFKDPLLAFAILYP